MTSQDSYEKTSYSLKDLTAPELKALIDQFPGGQEPDYAFLSALLDEYASRPEAQPITEEADAAQARLMDTLGLGVQHESPVARKKRFHVRVALVAAIVAVALLGITALADSSGFISAVSHTITESAWFQAVFGDKAIKGAEINDWQIPEKEEIIKRPAMERVSVDEELAEKLLGAQMTDIDEAVTIGGYKFTFQSFVMDENGLGVLTYTMENPGGFQALKVDEDYNTFFFDLVDGEISPSVSFELTEGGRDPSEPGTVGEDYELISARSFLAEGGSDTEKQVIAYLGVLDELDGYDTLSITCSSFELPHTREELTIDVPLVNLVPAKTFTSEDNSTAQISPLGITLSSPILKEHRGYSLQDCEFVIHFNDGSEYVVQSDQQIIDNTTVGLIADGDVAEKYGFSRLVDPNTITQVTLSGSYDDGTTIDLTFVP